MSIHSSVNLFWGFRPRRDSCFWFRRPSILIRGFSRGERPGSQEDSTRSTPCREDSTRPTPCFRENNKGYRCFFYADRHGGGVGRPGDRKWYHFSLCEIFGTADPFPGFNFSQLWREFLCCGSKSTGGVASVDEKEYKRMRNEFSQILS